MRIFPSTRSARIRFGLILVVGLGTIGYFVAYPLIRLSLYTPMVGDIIFQSLPRMDLVEAIEGITQSPFSHCGLIARRDNEWVVIESIGEVRETPLKPWVLRGRGSYFEVYRLRDPKQIDADRLLAPLKPWMGRSYDFHYAPDDEEIYCSELVYKAYERGLGLRIGVMERLGDLNWQPFEAFIRHMEEGKLPLDRLMITPVGLTRSALVERVYPAGSP